MNMDEEDVPSEATQTLSPRALRRAILPVDPLNWMSRAIRGYRFPESREEGIFTEAREEPKTLQLVLDRVFHLSETQRNVGGIQGVVKFANNIGRGDVDACDRFCRNHEPADGRW
jgi:hypothetical protein